MYSSSDDDGDALSYQWGFGDGSSSTGSVASHVFPTAGDYLVQLSVDDSYGGTDPTSATISVAEVTEPHVSNIELTVTARASRRSLSANLQWSGANGSRVRIYADGQEIVRTRNDGSWIDRKAVAGTSYWVCEDDGLTCSPDVVLSPPCWDFAQRQQSLSQPFSSSISTETFFTHTFFTLRPPDTSRQSTRSWAASRQGTSPAPGLRGSIMSGSTW